MGINRDLDYVRFGCAHILWIEIEDFSDEKGWRGSENWKKEISRGLKKVESGECDKVSERKVDDFNFEIENIKKLVLRQKLFQ